MAPSWRYTGQHLQAYSFRVCHGDMVLGLALDNSCRQINDLTFQLKGKCGIHSWKFTVYPCQSNQKTELPLAA